MELVTTPMIPKGNRVKELSRLPHNPPIKVSFPLPRPPKSFSVTYNLTTSQLLQLEI